MSRRSNRRDFTEPQRIGLLEDDVDIMEAEFRNRDNELEARLAKIQAILVGILISVTTACILFAVDVSISRR